MVRRHSVLPGYSNLVKYQTRGEVQEGYWSQPSGWTWGSYEVPNWLKTTIQVGDPTGVSSWGDVGKSWEEFGDDPSLGSFGNALLETASAVPIVGKIGKVAKVTSTATKAAKAGKVAKIGRKAAELGQKAYNTKASKLLLRPIETIVDYNNPLTRFYLGATGKAVEHAPKGLRTVLRTTTPFNRGRRYFTLGDAVMGTNESVPEDFYYEDQGSSAPDSDFLQVQKMGGNYYNNLNLNDMYFYATGGIPNNPGFNALPDYVQKKIIANMMYGGIKKFQGDFDGSEVSDDDMVMNDYSNDYDPGLTSYNFQNLDSFPDDYDQPLPGIVFNAKTTPVASAPPSAAPAPGYSTFVGPTLPPGYQAGTPSAKYEGVSIVDYLASKGLPSDYASRKGLAKSLGIGGYRGTANQNLQMIAMLQADSSPLSEYAAMTGAGTGGGGRRKSSAAAGMSEGEAEENPYVAINPDTGKPYIFDQVSSGDATTAAGESESGVMPWVLGGLGAAGAGYGAYKFLKGRGAKPSGIPMPPASSQKLLPSSDMAKQFQFRQNVNRGNAVLSEIRARGFYTADDLRVLKSAGYKNIEKVMQDFPKGTAAEAAKFVKQATKKVASKPSAVRQAMRAGWQAAKEAPLLKFLSRVRKYGGEEGYSGTFSGNTYYEMGGGYPYGGMVSPDMMGASGYDLPQFRDGSAGMTNGSEMYVTPEQMEMLRQQGYDFDVIG